MNVLCRFGYHLWRYHGQPVDRRICFLCMTRQHLVDNEWRHTP